MIDINVKFDDLECPFCKNEIISYGKKNISKNQFVYFVGCNKCMTHIESTSIELDKIIEIFRKENKLWE